MNAAGYTAIPRWTTHQPFGISRSARSSDQSEEEVGVKLLISDSFGKRLA